MTADETSGSDWERGTRELYARLIEAWDERNARDFALLFTALFQNTPATLDQRPDLAKQLTEELRSRLKQKPVPK